MKSRDAPPKPIPRCSDKGVLMAYVNLGNHRCQDHWSDLLMMVWTCPGMATRRRMAEQRSSEQSPALLSRAGRRRSSKHINGWVALPILHAVSLEVIADEQGRFCDGSAIYIGTVRNSLGRQLLGAMARGGEDTWRGRVGLSALTASSRARLCSVAALFLR